MSAEPGLASAWREGPRLHLLLDNTIEAIELGRSRIRAWADPFAPPPRTINRLEVVFEEIVSNIVRHGFAPGSGQRIHAVLGLTDGGVELTVEDDGEPFDPLAAPAPAPFSDLATAAVGGLGIELTRRFCAALAYERLPGRSAAAVGEAFAPVNRLTATIAARP